jgi:thiamine biosynthesis lipoprotein
VAAAGLGVARHHPRPAFPKSRGLESPRDQRLLGGVELGECAVATSGDYQQPFSDDLRHHHIIDPRCGESPPQLAGATILAPNAMMADALATAVMVLGPAQGKALVTQIPDVEAYLVTKELDVTSTAGFPLFSV